jgi:hypothetical protein
MLGRLRRSGGRQFAAAVLIFALMLQSIAAAVASGRFAADTDSRAGFEICRHNGPAGNSGDVAAPGNAPERSDAQCALCCIAAATHALETPPPSTEFHAVALTIAPWIFTEWRLPSLTVDASARPRGPPPAV